jgi:5-methylcytosine-specific restriction endonuclease McrA
LTTLRPRLSAAPPRLAYAAGDEKAADRRRDQLSPWRQWYRTERWRKLRQEVFVRDSYTCQRTRVVCAGRHPDSNSPVANHKTPHKGDPVLFWDINNIETVTKAVHDSLVQAEERAAERR